MLSQVSHLTGVLLWQPLTSQIYPLQRQHWQTFHRQRDASILGLNIQTMRWCGRNVYTGKTHTVPQRNHVKQITFKQCAIMRHRHIPTETETETKQQFSPEEFLCCDRMDEDIKHSCCLSRAVVHVWYLSAHLPSHTACTSLHREWTCLPVWLLHPWSPDQPHRHTSRHDMYIYLTTSTHRGTSHEDRSRYVITNFYIHADFIPTS